MNIDTHCRPDFTAASIAHEVTQPLAAITLNAEAALRCFEHGQRANQLHAALRAVVAASAQANAIVHSMRSLSTKIRQPAAGARFDHTLNQLLLQLDANLRLHRIEVLVELAHAALPLRTDPVQLHQVLRNLLANAIEAMQGVADRPRRLNISTCADGAGCLLVEVGDSGCGVGTASQNEGGVRLFDPFYSTKSNGMGMGLAICRAIVAAHGGRIWASAGAPHGSVFAFTVPFDDAAGTPSPSAPYP